MTPRGSRSIFPKTGNTVGRDRLFEEKDELGFRLRQCDVIVPVNHGEKARGLGLEIGERAELLAQSSSANYILSPA